MATGADIARVIGAWVTPASAVPMVAAIGFGYYVAPRGQADALLKTTLIVVALTAVSLGILRARVPGRDVSPRVDPRWLCCSPEPSARQCGISGDGCARGWGPGGRTHLTRSRWRLPSCS